MVLLHRGCRLVTPPGSCLVASLGCRLVAVTFARGSVVASLCLWSITSDGGSLVTPLSCGWLVTPLSCGWLVTPPSCGCLVTPPGGRLVASVLLVFFSRAVLVASVLATAIFHGWGAVVHVVLAAVLFVLPLTIISSLVTLRGASLVSTSSSSLPSIVVTAS